MQEYRMQYRCGKVNRMKNTRNVTDSVVWIGANDRRISLFENMFPWTGSFLQFLPDPG